MKYIWQHDEWPHFKWDLAALAPRLGACRKAQGYLQGQLAVLGFLEKETSRGNVLVEEALQTSAIEGEKIDADAVRSSVEKRLGIKLGGKNTKNRQADKLIEMLLDATAKFAESLTAKRLFAWQAGLFPTGYSGARQLETGKWRTNPIYVVSGPMGKERVHYEAPTPARVAREMAGFLGWWKDSRNSVDGLLRAGLAHLYFVMIHPFSDGNGRVARALADMALAQDESNGKRFYSLSREIIKNRRSYYDCLDSTGKSGLDITPWLQWFLETLCRAMEASAKDFEKVWDKTKFWKKHENVELSARQRKVLNKLLDAGPGEFKGGLTTRKYVAIAKVSRATAFREMADLQEKKLIKATAEKGRSAGYVIIC
jgi:Fic family protein